MSTSNEKVSSNSKQIVSNIPESALSEQSISPESKKCFEQYQKIAANAVRERLVSKQKTVVSQQPATTTVSQAIVEMLEKMGVEYAFGVSGGAIAPMWHTLQHSAIEVLHFRHEAGAAFAATEAYFAKDKPVVVLSLIHI